MDQPKAVVKRKLTPAQIAHLAKMRDRKLQLAEDRNKANEPEGEEPVSNESNEMDEADAGEGYSDAVTQPAPPVRKAPRQAAAKRPVYQRQPDYDPYAYEQFERFMDIRSAKEKRRAEKQEKMYEYVVSRLQTEAYGDNSSNERGSQQDTLANYFDVYG